MSMINWERTPELSYMICSLPRSGSTLLSCALEDTGVAGHPREYFGARLEGAYARKWSLPRPYVLRSFLEAMASNSMTSNGVCAIKIHWYDFVKVMHRAREEFGGSLSEHDLLETCFPGLRCIFIRREDRVRQVISFLRAMQSMQWRRMADEPVSERMARFKIDLDQVDPLVRVFAEQEAQWREFFSRNGLPACEVVYEDLVRDYETTTLDALDHLGVTRPAGLRLGPPRVVRQSDELTERAVAMYLERKQSDDYLAEAV